LIPENEISFGFDRTQLMHELPFNMKYSIKMKDRNVKKHRPICTVHCSAACRYRANYGS